MNTVQQPAGEAGVSRGKLWFGLLAGVVAWTTHLMGAYVIAEFGCLTAAGKETFFAASVVTWLVVAVTAVTLPVAVVATLTAHRTGLLLRRAVDADDDATPAMAYVADAGLYLSGLSAFIILVETIPILYYLRGC